VLESRRTRVAQSGSRGWQVVGEASFVMVSLVSCQREARWGVFGGGGREVPGMSWFGQASGVCSQSHGI
jgi:hypothetical protein